MCLLVAIAVEMCLLVAARGLLMFSSPPL